MVESNWDAYWRNAQSAAAHKDGGPQDEALERFWLQLFKTVFPALQSAPCMLDLACGNGAVARFALTSTGALREGVELSVCGVDESPAALVEMRKRQAGLYGVAANALFLPFRDAAFDLVTSQFGMEYAGPDVFTEAARVVRPGGVIAAVLHLRDGGIYKECAINLQAIDRFRNCNLLPGFEALFRAVVTGKQGADSKALLRSMDQEFARSVATVEDVFRRWGKGVATGMLFRLYTDVGHMYRRLSAYEPKEVFTWIALMVNELETYSGRMSSMLNASLDKAEFNRVVGQLEKQKLFIMPIFFDVLTGFPSRFV